MKHNDDDGKHSDSRCMSSHMTQQQRRKWQIDKLRQDGFYVDFVIDAFEDKPHPICHLVNYHTHGFEETWGHPELQVVAPLSPETAMDVFWTFADRVKAGEKFKAGERYDGIVKKPYAVRLVAAKEDRRKVLRVLIPDKKNRFPGDEGVDPLYKMQTQV